MADGHLNFDTKIDASGFTSGLGKVSSTAKSVLSGMATAAVTAVAGVSTAMIGAAGYAVKVGASFESAMSEVGAISGASGAALDALTEKAKEMGSSTKFSATEAANAMSYMAMAGWKTEDMLSGIDGIMNLAAASGEDLATTSDIVTDALTAFGMSASDSARFADVLAAASSNANTNVGMMGETFKYVAPVAGALGFSAEDTAVAIGLMANSGIKASSAGTALRSMMSRLASPTKEVKAAMDELGISLTDDYGNTKSLDEVTADLRKGFAGLSETQKAQMASTIAGQEAMSGLLAIVNTSDKDFNKLKDAIYNCDGAAADMAETMNDNLNGSVTILKSSLEGLAIEFYESVESPLRSAVEAGIDYVNRLTDAFKSGGLEVAVDEAGDIFAELAVKAVEAAPALVDAAVSLIKAFVKGIISHKTEIYNVAIQIAKTLANGLIKFLPKQMQKPCKEAVDSMAKSFENGGLKKAIETVVKTFDNLISIIGSVTKTVLPPMTSAIDFAAKHMDTLAPAILAVVTAYEAMKVIQAISGMISVANGVMAALEALEAANAITLVAMNGGLTAQQMIVGVLTGKVTLAAAAQAAYNAVLTAAGGPFGLILVAIAAAVAGFAAYKLATQESVSSIAEVNEELAEQADAIEETRKAREKEVASIDSQYGRYQKLWDELQGLVDENGKVKEGYEERAAFITSTLRDALGIEIELVEGVIQNYGELRKSISETIKAKREEAMVNAYADAYSEALLKQKKATEDLAKASSELKDGQDRVAQAEKELSKYRNMSTDELIENVDAHLKAEEEYNRAVRSLDNLQTNFDNASTAVSEYSSTIDNYETAVGKIEAGSADAGVAVLKMSANFLTARTATVDELRQQSKDMSNEYSNMKDAVQRGVMEMSDAQLAEYEYMALAAKQELMIAGDESVELLDANAVKMEDALSRTDLINAAKESVSDVAPAQAETLQAGETQVEEAAKQTTEDAVTNGVNSADTTTAATNKANETVDATTSTLESGKSNVQTAACEMMDEGSSGIESSNIAQAASSEAGKAVSNSASELAKGNATLKNASAAAFGAVAIGIASIKMGTSASKEVSVMLKSMVSALNAGRSTVTAAARNCANGIVTGFNSGNIGNAAKTTMTTAMTGIVSTINNHRAQASSAARAVAQSVISGFNGANMGSALKATAVNAMTSMISGINSKKSAAQSAGAAVSSAAISGAKSKSGGGYSIGYNISSGVASGIRAGASRAISAAISMARSALSAAKNALAIRSPSRKARKEIGQMYGAGVELGIKDKIKDVQKASVKLADNAVQEISVPDVDALANMARNTVLRDTQLMGYRVLEASKATGTIANDIDYGKMKTVFSEALKEMDIKMELNGEKVGELITPSVDRSMSDIDDLKRRGC